MLTELILGFAMKLISVFIQKGEEKAMWEKAIRARLNELDKHSGDVGQLHKEYDRMTTELKQLPKGG